MTYIETEYFQGDDLDAAHKNAVLRRYEESAREILAGLEGDLEGYEVRVSISPSGLETRVSPDAPEGLRRLVASALARL